MTPAGSTFTPDQRATVRESLGSVVEHQEAIATDFYRRLFERAPDVRHLFDADTGPQRQRFMAELGFLVSASRDLEVALERARELGRRHTGYGVVPEHYPIVVDCLLDSLGQGLGAEWTEPVAQAWVTLVDEVVRAMLDEESSS